MASPPIKAHLRLAWILAVPFLAVLASCSTSHGVEEATVSVGPSSAPSSGATADVGAPSTSPTSAQGWLDRTVRDMRGTDRLSFGSHLFSTGFEIQVSTGTAGPSGYRIVQRNGPDAAAEAPDGAIHYRADGIKVRTRANYEGLAEERDAARHLSVWGLGALSPRRTDLVTILDGLSADSSTLVDGGDFTARADLGTVLRILTGTSFRGPHGKPAFPSGSTVPVTVTPGTTRIERLQLDGEEVEQALNDLGLDQSHSLAGALNASDVVIDYS